MKGILIWSHDYTKLTCFMTRTILITVGKWKFPSVPWGHAYCPNLGLTYAVILTYHTVTFLKIDISEEILGMLRRSPTLKPFPMWSWTLEAPLIEDNVLFELYGRFQIHIPCRMAKQRSQPVNEVYPRCKWWQIPPPTHTGLSVGEREQMTLSSRAEIRSSKIRGSGCQKDRVRSQTQSQAPSQLRTEQRLQNTELSLLPPPNSLCSPLSPEMQHTIHTGNPRAGGKWPSVLPLLICRCKGRVLIKSNPNCASPKWPHILFNSGGLCILSTCQVLSLLIKLMSELERTESRVCTLEVILSITPPPMGLLLTRKQNTMLGEKPQEWTVTAKEIGGQVAEAVGTKSVGSRVKPWELWWLLHACEALSLDRGNLLSLCHSRTQSRA